MKNIIIFGTGGLCRNVLFQIDKKEYNIVEFWDNNSSKWGQKMENVFIRAPHSDIENIDKIIVASSFFDEIYKQLTEDIGISSCKIGNYLWVDKIDLLKYYRLHDELQDEEIKEILSYLEKHNLNVFNYSFTEKYKNIELQVDYDENAGLYYVMHHGKRMYMKKSLDNEWRVKEYYRNLLIEQDEKSPHNYKNYVGDMRYHVIIDSGVAEGNFALECLNKTDKLILVESDPEWVQALKYTFKDFQDKVVIINKFLADNCRDGKITIDRIYDENQIKLSEKCLIKMDIEGAETSAIKGADKTLDKAGNIKLIVCSYHYENAEREITELLKNKKLYVENSHGYMFFPAESEREIMPELGKSKRKATLRRGLITGVKTNEL